MRLPNPTTVGGKNELKSTDCTTIRRCCMNPVTVMLPIALPDPKLEHAMRLRAYELYIQRGMIHAMPSMTANGGSRRLNVGFQRGVTFHLTRGIQARKQC